MEKTNGNPKNVSRQTLYMAVLVSLTAGFFLGAAYTAFKLADDPGAPRERGMAGNAQQPVSPAGGAGLEERIIAAKDHLKAHPEDADAWALLGNLYYDTDQVARAIEAYEKSLSLGPGTPHVITDLGVMYRRNGEPEKAVRAFDRAIAADPDFEAARFNKGIVLMADLNDLAGAFAAWEELVAINPMAKTPKGERVADLVKRMKANQ